MIEFLLGSFSKLVGFDYKNKRQKDRLLLSEFLELLPSDGPSIRMLRDTDMADAIPQRLFTPFYQLREDWFEADKEFQVKKIERLKIAFIEQVKEFLSEYSKRCAGDGCGNLDIGFNDREERLDLMEYKENLNKLATKCYEKYGKFVRYARKEI
ncbi:hypothetical protein [Teredinibacter haidensis]|uniref:hypothetical protein n=1 Tax=Teredinibacter haidensis TaxID=2731755 RepID=UPI0009489E32|nr:hypothetical protein [Teredinibacter haidensis]